MAKSRAEIQKAYRERKKLAEEEAYLAKERKRRKTYYTPSNELPRNERIKRNAKNNENLRRWRQKRREAILQQEHETENTDNNPTETSTSGYESASSSLPTLLQVRLNFANRKRNGSRVRTSRALSRAYANIKNLKVENINLTKRTKTLKKRLERMRKKEKTTDSPRGKADRLIEEAGLTKIQRQKIRKQLVLGNAVIEEIKTAHKEIKGKRKGQVISLSNLVSGKIVKKYRGNKWLSKQTGIARKSLASVKIGSKFESRNNHTRNRIRKMYTMEVETFFERDDNSRCMPGKADARKVDNIKKQTRILTDYMAKLYMKFTAENPSVKMSRATFCRMRPHHILPTSFINRSTCLFTKRQNMALLLKSLRKLDIDVPANPESYAKETTPKKKISKTDYQTKLLSLNGKRLKSRKKKKKEICYKNCRNCKIEV